MSKRMKRDQPDVASPLLSIDETVAYLKLARSVVYQRLNEFDLVKLGRRCFITKASADRYIERNTKPHRAAHGERPTA